MTTFSTRVTFDHVRNTAAGFTAANPVLGYGVTGLETDTGKIKVGDGVAAWAALPYLSGAAHQHPIGDVTGLQAALDAKATPADVTAAVAAVVDAAPGTLDTLNELAAALGDDANFASTVTNALAAKAPLASPTFTGTVGGITKAMVGLGSVDNTADAAKPVSTAQAAADTAVASAAAADATSKANAAQAAAVQRANHTGTQAIGTVDGLQTALDGKASTTDARLSDAREWSAATVTQAEAEAGTSTSRLAFSPLRVFQAIAAWWAASTAKAKLDGIATGATANATDAQLRDRATHTGFQAATTITGLGGAATLNVGTTAGTVAAGNDSRLTDQRVPTDGSVTDAKIGIGGLSTSSLNWAAIQPWAANTAYAKGDLVSFAGIAYRRSAAGTSGAMFNTANWQQITPSNPVISVDGATGAVTVVKAATYLFTPTSRPADASGSDGNYTWSLPSTARYIVVDAIGPGGGGGSGRRGAAGTVRGGGGGGGAGGRSVYFIPVSELGGNLGLTVWVPAGGAGGAARTTDNTDGAAGLTGWNSAIVRVTATGRFLAVAYHGQAGGAGTTTGGSAGGTSWQGTAQLPGIGGAGGSSAAPPTGSNALISGAAASAGGGGAGVNNSGGTAAGGSGGGSEVSRGYSDVAAGGAAGGGNGATPVAGTAGGAGYGGGGGGSSTTSNAGAGGNGSSYGGGGGGGGASQNGFNSGAGGNGGDACVRITVWF